VLPPGRRPVLLAGTLFVGGLASSLIVATLLRNEARVSPELVWWLTLAIGAVLAGFVTALVVTLGRGRARALGLVEEKTGQLRHQALHDALTDLPNRVLALDRAEQLLARARREHASMAVLFLDLDGFKAVNDAYGHAAGDELLRTVAERLELTIRASDTAARLGGDEFVVLVDGGSLDVGPELVAERVLEVLRQPYQIAGRSRTLTASMGVATGFRAGAEELLRDADIALYEAKEAGGDRYVVFRSEMQTVVQDRLTLEMDLAGALERGEFFLAYQPMIALHSGAIIGAEALIRWQHPERGELAPGAFIPLAEKSGTIVSIGRWVLDEASLQAARWNDAGHRLSLAVNLAARQLDGDQLFDDVRNALQHSGLNAERLWLEVTETTLMRDPAASARRMHSLKELGVKIAIDDFGTGYSSLAYLQRFPADLVKIDRSFVQAASRSQDSSALVHTLVQLGASLRLATIAEGIEEQDQLDAVLRQNCDYGQGYLFSRPVPPDKLEELLTLTRSHRRSARAAASGNAGAK
jgi:diguanylate cyclase (GGDEF)-like protein